MMKNIILLMALATLATLCPGRSAAQEFKRGYTLDNDTSIILLVNGNKSLVCSYANGYSTLTVLDTSVASATAVTLPHGIKIKDMTYYSGRVYFCGYQNAGADSSDGVFGSFTVSTVPSNFRYTTVSEVDSLYKVRLFGAASTVHAALLGSVNGYDHVIDAIHTNDPEYPNSNWGFYIGSHPFYDYKLYDLAVCDSDVVVSGRVPEQNYGELFFYRIPDAILHTFLWASMQEFIESMELERAVMGPVLLERLVNDSIYAIYNVATDTIFISNIRNREIVGEAKFSSYVKGSLIDATRNKNGETVNILMQYSNSFAKTSFIWNVAGLPAAGTSATCKGRYYFQEELTSIQYCPPSNYEVMLSGRQASSQQDVCWFNFYGSNQCTYKKDRTVDGQEIKKKKAEELPVVYSHAMKTMYSLSCTTSTVSISTLCGYYY